MHNIKESCSLCSLHQWTLSFTWITEPNMSKKQVLASNWYTYIQLLLLKCIVNNLHRVLAPNPYLFRTSMSKEKVHNNQNLTNDNNMEEKKG